MPTELKPLKPHRFAAASRMMTPQELAELMQQIQKDGQEEAVDTFKESGETYTLDGRNREAACIALGIKPKYRAFKGSLRQALSYVKNKRTRRNESPGERAESTAKLLEFEKELGEAVTTQVEAAAQAGVSRSTLQRAVKRSKGAAPKAAKSWTIEEVKANDELYDLFTAISAVYGNDDTRAIRTGIIGLSLKDIRQLAKLPKAQMLEIRDLIMEEHWSPQKAIDFLKTMPDEHSTLKEVKHFTLASPAKQLVIDIAGFRYTCQSIKSVK